MTSKTFNCEQEVITDVWDFPPGWTVSLDKINAKKMMTILLLTGAHKVSRSSRTNVKR